MKSVKTEKKYESIGYIHVDTKALLFKSIDGVSFMELKDGSWLCLNGEHRGTVRYKSGCSHGTGLVLNPIYELVDGEWFWILSGKPAPPAVEK
jgi:hypothetical protein